MKPAGASSKPKDAVNPSQNRQRPRLAMDAVGRMIRQGIGYKQPVSAMTRRVGVSSLPPIENLALVGAIEA